MVFLEGKLIRLWRLCECCKDHIFVISDSIAPEFGQFGALRDGSASFEETER